MLKTIFRKPESLKDRPTHYCPGCGHGIVHRIIAEVIDDMGARERVLSVAPVGCAVFAYDYFNFDCMEAPHGRTPAVATGLKRVRPDHLVFSYQGDGDLAAIGTAEIIHCANRGENISVIFVNNGIYGMTGGQLAPTTLIQQYSTTTIQGRDPKTAGYPLKITEMLAITPGSVFLARASVHTPKEIRLTKKYIRKSFEIQDKKLGFSLVEILSPCPVNWRLSPVASLKRIEEVVSKEYPLGVIKDIS
ncbi:2-oxoglutarate oxidoreductase [Candidatus Sumerlaeota bacterium]|nr:2-oxoglutarate oxidoreductase [Candidatus Sumerlaeota bacterium]